MSEYQIIDTTHDTIVRTFMTEAAADLECRRMNRAAGYERYRVGRIAIPAR